MTKRLVFSIKPLKNVKNFREVSIEYMPGYVKTFIGKDLSKLLAETEHALDNKVPTLSGAVPAVPTYETEEKIQK